MLRTPLPTASPAGRMRADSSSPSRRDDVHVPVTEQILESLSAGDRAAAARRAKQLVSHGLSLEAFIDRGLAPAMAEVGARWESAVWTVADEHLATAAAEAALSAAADQVRAPPFRSHVVVCCVEGDWHSLPSQMLAEMLTARGYAVRFLGASQPTDALVDYARRHRPEALMLTCTMPTSLPALAHCIAMLHPLGIPTFVGGRALGVTPARAHALGADGWAATAGEAARLLQQGTRTLRGVDSTSLPNFREREALTGSWVTAALTYLTHVTPRGRSTRTGELHATGDDLAQLLTWASLSVLVSDPGLLVEQTNWLDSRFRARGLPAHAVGDAVTALRTATPDRAPAATVDSAFAQLPRHPCVAWAPASLSRSPGSRTSSDVL